jgi:hypothetical protein
MLSPNGTVGVAFQKTGITDWSPFTGAGTGTMIFVVSFGYDANSANDALLQMANVSFPGDGVFEYAMFNDNLEIDFFSEGTAGDWEVQSTTGINQDTGWPNWKMLVLVQPGDGSGPVLYEDGVDIGNYVGVGAGEEDLWFDQWLGDTNKLPDRLIMGAVYSTPTTIASPFMGAMDYFAYTQTALTSTQVTALYTAWSTPV